jgi:hypothetical protein
MASEDCRRLPGRRTSRCMTLWCSLRSASVYESFVLVSYRFPDPHWETALAPSIITRTVRHPLAPPRKRSVTPLAPLVAIVTMWFEIVAAKIERSCRFPEPVPVVHIIFYEWCELSHLLLPSAQTDAHGYFWCNYIWQRSSMVVRNLTLDCRSECDDQGFHLYFSEAKIELQKTIRWLLLFTILSNSFHTISCRAAFALFTVLIKHSQT